ncbi:hypothetical protein [uncultured Fibrobacter sp.]|uniref:hypothetical protein n=1 Tax=uncultured Fibrobacter sp. TaxID=261512 RepID=UPI002804D9AA|nr:hypothetical protein [uncultured Fibrobacter sp.]
MPLICSLNNEEILGRTEIFDAGKYAAAIDEFCKMEGVIEKGNASLRVAELISSICKTGKLELQKYVNEIVL